ncbi:hypothetical protein CLAFUW4_00387 [Fulvia fulva]|uniref:uncharacterized protein n=1 Tax=Passalora fulva TaxID=5499 RepID=UPI0004E9AE90|nr:uncharacterized protein CLAFUR5_20122 [Fulvia fulva]KAK4635198.1 hypothetical protein CLAFUR4_00387 [Fulvia fulva]KAK4637818.1 hypothetical protein CLAFUR0_00388 [Fulvia fulva]WMI38748.1 hypothetical protein CLAFUR5_20122 [Fulvia fulva]WPV09837.1 hypothetical protein CLAFUW4_00387 [Fulvia fulva]WPV23842.1 hypothetical protein CLAFUW7_00391 [Fulvia fulva]
MSKRDAKAHQQCTHKTDSDLTFLTADVQTAIPDSTTATALQAQIAALEALSVNTDKYLAEGLAEMEAKVKKVNRDLNLLLWMSMQGGKPTAEVFKKWYEEQQAGGRRGDESGKA